MNVFNPDKRKSRLAVILASALALAACSDNDDNPPTPENADEITYIVPLSPSQEVPPVSSATATGEGNLVVNSTTGAISGSVSVSGLSGQATMAHIHQAAEGVNGGVIIGLDGNADGSVWSVPTGTVLDTAQLAALSAGDMYLNVHTAANDAGEIRGQIRLTTEFTVRIDNVSTDNSLPTSTGTVPVPLSPGVYLVHRADRNPLLDPRDPASAALEALAEDGDPSQFPASIPGSAVFNTPVGATLPGPLTPGAYYSFSFRAAPGDHLAIATMFVQSNDWFYSTTDDNNDSIPLFSTEGVAISGDVTSMLSLWESGTEEDEEPGTGPNQAPRQTGPNTGTTEVNTVGSLAGRGKSVTLNGDVIQVTITPN